LLPAFSQPAICSGVVFPENPIQRVSNGEAESAHRSRSMLAIRRLIAPFIANLFKSRRRLNRLLK